MIRWMLPVSTCLSVVSVSSRFCHHFSKKFSAMILHRREAQHRGQGPEQVVRRGQKWAGTGKQGSTSAKACQSAGGAPYWVQARGARCHAEVSQGPPQ